MTAGKPRKNYYMSIAACRVANGLDPDGRSNSRLIEIERLARELMILPPDERAAAALKAFPPSNIREALWHYAKGASPGEAARRAGANPNAFELYLKSDYAGTDLRGVMRGVLELDYAPKAFAFLNQTVHDPAMPARVRVDAAKIIIDRAGYIAAPPVPDAATKELQEMSLDELNRFIVNAEAKLAANAKDITSEVVDETGDSLNDTPAGDTPPEPR